MSIRFHNALTRTLEAFEPQDPPRVTIYTCGPTVYDFAHIGNFRTFLASDVLRRFLVVAGHDVHHVMNITDVGHMVDDTDVDGGGLDKMAAAGERIREQKEASKKTSKKDGTAAAEAVENPDDPYQIADFYAAAFVEDGRRLGLGVCLDPESHRPRATRHVDGMISMIETLIERGHAYVGADGVVYYSVESFPAYGALSGNSLADLREGEGGRVSAGDQANKRHPADFMLWKPDPSHLMKWDSPWGTGYPGWHLECSVMAMDRLGAETIDIHTGGEDLVFPHHECEIAQSCGATGRSTFARYWLHSRFLMVEGAKMSKSAGTFYTVRDILEGKATEGRPVAPAVLRYELIKAHYRTSTNFTARGLKESAGAVRKLSDFRHRMADAAGDASATVTPDHPVLAEFLGALGDDLNMSAALAVVFPWMGEDHPDPAESLAVFDAINRVLAVAPMVAPDGSILDGDGSGDSAGGADDVAAEVAAMCAELDAARAAKDFGRADELRDAITARGWTVKTTRDGTSAAPELG
ncbi:MAG: cysteine--tRNA ligase [Phycisphaerales bacterium]